MHRTARRSVVALVGLALTAGLGVTAAPASAASVTVRSPIKRATGGIDITSTTIDYDRAQGRLAVTLVMRGAVGVGRGEGPTYSVLMYGPRNVPGGFRQSVVALAATGNPVQGALIFNPVGTSADTKVPVSVRYVRNRVEFRADDAKLKNLPVQFFDVQTSLDRIYFPGDPSGTDAVRGRLAR